MTLHDTDGTPFVGPQPGRQTMFLTTPADIAIYGGARGGGKTYALLMEAARKIGTPGFCPVVFRRTYPQITAVGGLVDTARQLYGSMKPRERPTATDGGLTWHFPTGNRLEFRHLQHEDTVQDFYGAQIPLICYDQLEQFTERQFVQMLASNRSACGVRPYIRATANPIPGWLADLIGWWIAEDGYAHLDRIGVLRWMVRSGGALVWGADPDELVAQLGRDAVYDSAGHLLAKSVTFIPASVYDNAELLSKDPAYLANLMALPEVERKRLLGDPQRGGNWRVRPDALHFKRQWFRIADDWPRDARRLRYWDMAATEQKGKSDPDFTAGCLLAELDGVFYVIDMRHERDTPLANERLVRNTAVMDGYEVPVRMEQEGGASGKSLCDHYARNVLRGFAFAGLPSKGDKVSRAMPLSAAAEAGNVCLVRGQWNAALLDELELFPDGDHDDQVDALAGAFNCLARSGGGDPYIPGSSQDTPEAKQLDALREQAYAIARSLSTPEERAAAEAMLRAAGVNL